MATIINIVAYFRGFRANGNLVYGLYPFTQTSPAVFTVPLYIISFAGVINNTKIDKISIKNYNVIKVITLGIIAIISSLTINFVSGFLVTTAYVAICTNELLKRKQIKNVIIFIVTSIVIFAFLATIICIIPTRQVHMWDNYRSAYWVGVDTKGERRVDFVREKTMKAAKLFGEADLQGVAIDNEPGYYFYRMQNYYSTSGIMAFLGVLSRYGWIASFGLIVFLLLFCIKLIISSKKIKETYGKLITIGIATLFITQIICNLAMNIGIIEVAEFDLPLISGGKSTIIVDMICISLFLSVYRRKDINFEEPKKSKIFTKIEDFFFEEC